MDGFQFFFGRFSFYGQEFICTAIEEVPEFFQETVYTVNTIGIPRFGLFYRTEEHFVHTQGVGTVFFDNHVGIDYIVH